MSAPINHGTSFELTKHEQRVLSMINEREVICFLQDLIRTRSDYPPGDCREIVKIIGQKLDDAGCNFEIYENDKHRPNLVSTLPTETQGPELLLHAHVDTVSPGDLDRWRVDPFGGEIKGQRIYGRGAGDDKGSVAAQVMAFISLARTGVKLNGRLRLAAVADEESGGMVGTKWLHDEQILSPDYLVVGEQTNNSIAIAERVACGIDLTIKGKSAHGAMPWIGDNAVLKSARVLTWLQNHYFPILETRQHQYLPPPTLNIGRISGGTRWNIVPEICKIEMDRRLLPGESRDAALQEIKELLDQYSKEVDPIQYELYSDGEVASNINTHPEEPFVHLANSSLEAVSGETKMLTGYAQTSDGRWFADDGIPIILFGPGEPALAHTEDEYVLINQLIEATRFLTLLPLRWLGPENQQG
jgi:succinyl-diaminopimelate desuccinylase